MTDFWVSRLLKDTTLAFWHGRESMGIGPHWSQSYDVAKAFALGDSPGSSYRDLPDDGMYRVGLVLEAEANGGEIVGEDDPEWEERKYHMRLVRGHEQEANIARGTPLTVVRVEVCRTRLSPSSLFFRPSPGAFAAWNGAWCRRDRVWSRAQCQVH